MTKTKITKSEQAEVHTAHKLCKRAMKQYLKIRKTQSKLDKQMLLLSSYLSTMNAYLEP